MKRFLSQAILKDFLSNKKSSKPHLLLRNALALSHPSKILEFYEQTQPQELEHLKNQELFGVLKTYLNSYEPRNYSAALDLIKMLEKREFDDNLNLEIQKLVVLSGDSIEAVVKYFKSTLAKMENVPKENRANFYAGFLEIICGSFKRLQAGLSILDQMTEKGINPTPEIILSLLKNTTSDGDIDSAMKLFKRVESGEFGFNVDRKMLIQAAKTVAIDGDATNVRYMLQLNTFKEWCHDVEFWAPVILAHEQKGDLDGVLKNYQNFRKRGMAPTHEVLESIMRAYSNDNNISGVVRIYGLTGILSMTPSIEMHKIIIKAHLKLNEDEVAWNRCFNALYFLNKDKCNVESWDIPHELTLPLAQNAKGKHIAFVLERLTLSELPRAVFPKFILSLISHWITKDANDPHLAVNMYQNLLPGGQFEDVVCSESKLSALICMAEIQKNELKQGIELFEKNFKTWTTQDCYHAYSEIVKGYLNNGQVKNAISAYSEAQKLGYVSSALLEAILEHSDKLDSNTLESLGQVSIDSGCMPCHMNEPRLFKRMNDMDAYAKF